METPKHIHPELFDLLDGRLFEELNKQDQTLVLQHVDEVTFNEMSLAVSAFVSLNETLDINEDKIPDITTLTHNKKPWYMHPIPFYQAAAICILLVAAMAILRLQDNNKASTLPPVQVSDIYSITTTPVDHTLQVQKQKVEESITQIESTLSILDTKEPSSASNRLYPEGFVLSF